MSSDSRPYSRLIEEILRFGHGRLLSPLRHELRPSEKAVQLFEQLFGTGLDGLQQDPPSFNPPNSYPVARQAELLGQANGPGCGRA
jgi:hypothetical protein